MRNATHCSCGRRKYADADCCEACWNRDAAYDERRRDDPTRCRCGGPKIADADCCEACWDASAAYDDGRH